MDCIFCKIANGEIPSKKLYEDDQMIAFYDLEPQGPVHFLVIPKEHIKDVPDLKESHKELLGNIFLKIAALAEEVGIGETGYRVVSNVGKDGQQSVPHLHFHVIGGRSMQWPPG